MKKTNKKQNVTQPKLPVLKSDDTESIYDKIHTFLETVGEIYREPLRDIIDNMLEKCKYVNGESLERHNWVINENIKLENIPSKNCDDFGNKLVMELESNKSQSTIELLWGDVQLGKREHALIIMWFSIYILRRSVFYVFRNLTIDKQQLQENIKESECSSFFEKYINSYFQKFYEKMNKNKKPFDNTFHLNYKLPNLEDPENNLITKNSMGKKIYCCLMNDSQLIKIDAQFNAYILKHNELVNISFLVDESDIPCPTSKNDMTANMNKKDTTKCEKLLAQIYKKVVYVLHITGTAHSLLYNITTKLTGDDYVQLKISKVHKMTRVENYYGLFNDKILFDTSKVKDWWTEKDKKYNIGDDYDNNIKNIISLITKRKNKKYNSFLISEEKIIKEHDILACKIINDFKNLFVIVFNGKKLGLYFPKNIIKCVENGVEKFWENKSIFNIKDCSDDDYYYYCKCNDSISIKNIYKLLSYVFSSNKLKVNTVVTITGKYGERGYSFVSDDYDEYSLHLTDQYFVSHSTFNCTDIMQRLRLQGKYNDNPILTLWTCTEMCNVMTKFFVPFIKRIERDIMSCNGWNDIKKLIESIIDFDSVYFHTYCKYIDVAKKRKNLKIEAVFDKHSNGHKIISGDYYDGDNLEEYICSICKDLNIQKFDEFVNDIHIINESDFKNFKYKPSAPINVYFDVETLGKLNKHNKKINSCPNQKEFKSLLEKYFSSNDDVRKFTNDRYIIKNHTFTNNVSSINSINLKNPGDMALSINSLTGECVIKYIDLYSEKEKNNCVTQNPKMTSEKIYKLDGKNVFCSELKEKYKGKTLDYYYWKTVNNDVYYFDNTKTTKSTKLSILDNDNCAENIINNKINTKKSKTNIAQPNNETLKNEVWEHHCGNVYTSDCFLCGEQIKANLFECHKTDIDELKPICIECFKKNNENNNKNNTISNRRKKWTDEEVNYLKTNCNVNSENIAKILGRSTRAIQEKRKELKNATKSINENQKILSTQFEHEIEDTPQELDDIHEDEISFLQEIEKKPKKKNTQNVKQKEQTIVIENDVIILETGKKPTKKTSTQKTK